MSKNKGAAAGRKVSERFENSHSYNYGCDKLAVFFQNKPAYGHCQYFRRQPENVQALTVTIAIVTYLVAKTNVMTVSYNICRVGWYSVPESKMQLGQR